jgi:hypothetical protein
MAKISFAPNSPSTVICYYSDVFKSKIYSSFGIGLDNNQSKIRAYEQWLEKVDDDYVVVLKRIPSNVDYTTEISNIKTQTHKATVYVSKNNKKISYTAFGMTKHVALTEAMKQL